VLLIGLILLIVLLALGVPVVWTFLGVAVFLVISLGYDPNFLLPYGYSQLNSTLLLAIPMFIIAGKLIERGGIGDVIVKWAEVLLGRIKGGLGVASVLASAVFGSISGSALAALSTIGSIMFGKLHKAGYPRGFAAALMANASILGLLIPPSGIMILYAWLANVSVLAAFLSTLIPGLILTAILSVVTLVYMRSESARRVRAGNQTLRSLTLFRSRRWRGSLGAVQSQVFLHWCFRSSFLAEYTAGF
jgi:C4-dicarboxylate transporter DctM subunit